MRQLLFAGCLLFIAGCDGPQCENTNPIFDQYTYDQLPYRTEVIRQLRDSSNQPITYWIQRYIHSSIQDSNEYIVVHCKGQHLCADAMMLMKEWGDMEYVKITNAGGYGGAGLIGLEYSIDDNANTLIYKDIDHIYD